MSSSSTSSLSSRVPPCSSTPSPLPPAAFPAASACRTSARPRCSGRRRARPARSPAWSARSARAVSRSCCTASFSACHCACKRVRLGLQIGQFLFELRQPLLATPCPFSFFSASRSISSCICRRSDLVQLRRHRVDLGAQLGRRFVHQVDRLVRQEAVGDVAVGSAPPPPPAPKSLMRTP